MTMKNKIFKSIMGLTVFTSALVFMIGCGHQTAAEKGVESAIMPDANLVIRYDIAKARDTKIGKSAENLFAGMENFNQSMVGSDKSLNDVQQKFQEKLGLEEDDFSTFLFAMDMSNIDFDASEPPEFSSLNMVGALGMEKAVSGEDLVEFFKEVAEEEGQTLEISEVDHKGVTIYTLTNPDAENPDDISEISIAVITNGYVVLFGSEASVKSAVERADSGEMAEYSSELAEMKNLVPENAQIHALFAMTPKMKEMARTETEVIAEEGSDPASQGRKALGSISGAAMSIVMADKLEFTMTGSFGNKEDAASVSALLNNQVIGFVKMMGGQMVGSRPMPALQSLASEQDGNLTHLKLVITEQDLKTLKEISEENK